MGEFELLRVEPELGVVGQSGGVVGAMLVP